MTVTDCSMRYDMRPEGREPRARGQLVATARACARVAILALAPQVALAQSDRATGELAVESRLVAPCCWTQTLDVHDSPLAVELRREIAARLRAGERPDAIEDDLAGRYGARIRAVPRGHDPRSNVLVGVAIGMALAALAVAHAIRRWSGPRAKGASKSSDAAPISKGKYHDAIDAELEALDRE